MAHTLTATPARVDYRAGIPTLPLFRSGYVPDPGAALRPAIGVGITPGTPRFFMALRFERNAYPFSRPLNNTVWIANSVIFNDTEVILDFVELATKRR